MQSALVHIDCGPLQACKIDQAVETGLRLGKQPTPPASQASPSRHIGMSSRRRGRTTSVIVFKSMSAASRLPRTRFDVFAGVVDRSKRALLMKERVVLNSQRPLWIKDPLAILAEGAERGIVAGGGRIIELVPAGRTPLTADTRVFEAGSHVVVPGLINTHHHFYQTLARTRQPPWIGSCFLGCGRSIRSGRA